MMPVELLQSESTKYFKVVTLSQIKFILKLRVDSERALIGSKLYSSVV